MVSSSVQAPWLLPTRISEANKTLCLLCCQYKKNPMRIRNQLPSSTKKLSEKKAQKLVNPPDVSLGQAGSLSPGWGNYAHKERSRDQAGGQLGHTSSSGRLGGLRHIKKNSRIVLLQVQGLDSSTPDSCPRSCSMPSPAELEETEDTFLVPALQLPSRGPSRDQPLPCS